MYQRQPDDRIHVKNLGSFTPDGKGKRFVINLKQGVPRNACIEKDRDGVLRCWASHSWLDEEAAAYVRENATFNPEGNSFCWNEGVRVQETRKG